MLVLDVMSIHPVTVREGTPVKEALRLLADHHITVMPVVTESGKVVGVVSEADLIREVLPLDPRAHEIPPAQRDRPRARVVDEVMRAPRPDRAPRHRPGRGGRAARQQHRQERAGGRPGRAPGGRPQPQRRRPAARPTGRRDRPRGGQAAAFDGAPGVARRRHRRHRGAVRPRRGRHDRPAARQRPSPASWRSSPAKARPHEGEPVRSWLSGPSAAVAARWCR